MMLNDDRVLDSLKKTVYDPKWSEFRAYKPRRVGCPNTQFRADLKNVLPIGFWTKLMIKY